MAGNFVWAAPAAIPSPPASITDGSIGKWGLIDVTAIANVSHIAFQVQFSLGASETGQVNFYLVTSINGALLQGGQNEPATLDALDIVPLNGNAAPYVSPVMVVNRPTTGIWPPQVQLAALVDSGGSAITISSSIYRTANWVS